MSRRGIIAFKIRPISEIENTVKFPLEIYMPCGQGKIPEQNWIFDQERRETRNGGQIGVRLP